MARNELLPHSFMLMSFSMAALLLTVNGHPQQRVPIVAFESTDLPDTTVVPTTASLDARVISVAAKPAKSTQDPPDQPWLRTMVKTLLPLVTQQRMPVLEAEVDSSLRVLVEGKVVEPVRLEVDLSDRQVSLYKAGKRQATYPVGIGQPGWETPTGTFHITMMEHDPLWQHPITRQVIPPGPDNPLGSRWIGFWSTKDYEIGFHGTNHPELVGQAVSHGCLRMHDADVRALFDQVSVGTPVIVHP